MPFLSNSPYVQILGFKRAFSPASFANLALWLKADAITGLSDGQAVATWPDSSGNGKHATQATGASQPLYKTNIINGKPVVRFDGTDDYLNENTFVIDLRERTIFVVARENVEKSNVGVFVIQPAAGNDYDRSDGVLHTMADNTRRYQVVGATASNYLLIQSGSGATPLAIYAERKTAGDGKLYVNGALVGSDTTFTEFASASGGGYLVGARFLGGAISATTADVLNGDIAEIIVYSRALSTTERQQVEQYLGSKYGFALA